jgi:hypothetical protein
MQFILVDFWTKPFSCLLYKKHLKNKSPGLAQMSSFIFIISMLKKSFRNHSKKHDLFVQLHLVLQLKQPMYFEMLAPALTPRCSEQLPE